MKKPFGGGRTETVVRRNIWNRQKIHRSTLPSGEDQKASKEYGCTVKKYGADKQEKIIGSFFVRSEPTKKQRMGQKRFGKCVRSQKKKQEKGAFGKSGVQKKNQSGGTPFFSAIRKNRAALRRRFKGLGVLPNKQVRRRFCRRTASYG